MKISILLINHTFSTHFFFFPAWARRKAIKYFFPNNFQSISSSSICCFVKLAAITLCSPSHASKKPTYLNISGKRGKIGKSKHTYWVYTYTHTHPPILKHICLIFEMSSHDLQPPTNPHLSSSILYGRLFFRLWRRVLSHSFAFSLIKYGNCLTLVRRMQLIKLEHPKNHQTSGTLDEKSSKWDILRTSDTK